MTNNVMRSDRVVLVGWSDAVDAEDVLLLLHEIDRAREALGVPLVAILSIAQDVAVLSANVRAVLASSLPRILSPCQKLLISLGPTTLRQRLIRAFFSTHSIGVVKAQRVQLCDALPEALECAQRLAPQEVLALQRALLKQSIAPRRALP